MFVFFYEKEAYFVNYTFKLQILILFKFRQNYLFA